jgi:hypothetical protein
LRRREKQHIQKKEIELQFNAFGGCCIEFGIKPADIYNFNETGFRIEVLNGRVAITHTNSKAVYFSITAIECICVDETAIQLMLILEKAILLQKFFDNNLHKHLHTLAFVAIWFCVFL